MCIFSLFSFLLLLFRAAAQSSNGFWWSLTVSSLASSYTFVFSATIPGHIQVFSSYPGRLISGDDYYLLSSGLVSWGGGRGREVGGGRWVWIKIRGDRAGEGDRWWGWGGGDRWSGGGGGGGDGDRERWGGGGKDGGEMRQRVGGGWGDDEDKEMWGREWGRGGLAEMEGGKEGSKLFLSHVLSSFSH